MKKLLNILVLLLLTMQVAHAQQTQHFERIHAVKVAYITDRLHLTSVQAEKFWPVYNAYEDDTRSTRKSYFQKYKNTNPKECDENTCRQFVDDDLDYQQQIITLKRKYNDEFLHIISSQQLASLYKSEREFKEMLIRRLGEHHNGKGHWHSEK